MKKGKQLLKNLVWVIPFMMLGVSCSDDENDDMALTPLEIEINQLKAATAKYADIEVATNEGFFDVSGFVPNMGHHYLLPPRVDQTFVLEEPEIILYAPDENGVMQFVAVEYVAPIEDLDNPGTPPEGFTGEEDEWEINPNLSQWQLHVWIVKENPDGIFSPTNSTVGNGS
ncbi:hypothetical protein MTsPCn9_23010 [Croceitalea sp. MTPC9]|uniref:hypothetical protein n=1 Tax=unclassified Croceitalea TaxID=2632280 RepID=UPI002B37EE06|nr:hypothetical protein MTsPCn6_20530 [Croceitalea sp. MTPC6]GMN17363.1 hypothetical protein MTsPCn9_23010 [Croceitalea sp. MTPC9]